MNKNVIAPELKVSMDAEQMFKKLGYEIGLKTTTEIHYIHYEEFPLIFRLHYKDKEVYYEGLITKKLLPAINQQIKEIRW